jgi:starvation-inducible DNA-binding protein
MTRQKAQRFGDLKPMKVALSENIRKASVIDLNRALADTIVLRDLYKKHHWQVTGPTFRELHLLFDEHQAQQGELIDEIAERIMQLGGVSIAMGADAAEESEIPRPPRDREPPAAQLERLVQAHEIVLSFARQAARRASEQGDDGSNDLFVSDVIRLNEKQAWFVSEHLTRTE